MSWWPLKPQSPYSFPYEDSWPFTRKSFFHGDHKTPENNRPFQWWADKPSYLPQLLWKIQWNCAGKQKAGIGMRGYWFHRSNVRTDYDFNHFQWNHIPFLPCGRTPDSHLVRDHWPQRQAVCVLSSAAWYPPRCPRGFGSRPVHRQKWGVHPSWSRAKWIILKTICIEMQICHPRFGRHFFIV